MKLSSKWKCGGELKFRFASELKNEGLSVQGGRRIIHMERRITSIRHSSHNIRASRIEKASGCAQNTTFGPRIITFSHHLITNGHFLPSFGHMFSMLSENQPRVRRRVFRSPGTLDRYSLSRSVSRSLWRRGRFICDPESLAGASRFASDLPVETRKQLTKIFEAPLQRDARSRAIIDS